LCAIVLNMTSWNMPPSQVGNWWGYELIWYHTKHCNDECVNSHNCFNRRIIHKGTVTCRITFEDRQKSLGLTEFLYFEINTDRTVFNYYY
jgi:hypothetical protein